MNQILGGDTNSLLFHFFELKRGLAYYSESWYDGSYNFGEMGINASVLPSKIDEAVDTIFEVFEMMKTQKPTEKIVDKVRMKAKYSLTNTFESNEGHVYGIELKMDDGLTPKSFMEGFDRVIPDSVREAARKYLPDKKNGNYVLCIRNPLS